MILKPGCWNPQLNLLDSTFSGTTTWQVTRYWTLLKEICSQPVFSSADDAEIFVVFRMASTNVENEIANDPEYITYLLDQSQEFDWYFDVGNGLNNTSVVSLEKLALAILSLYKLIRTLVQFTLSHVSHNQYERERHDTCLDSSYALPCCLP